MILYLKVNNGFYDKDEITIDFDSGLNILASKNGGGKSHTLECINYSFFGTSALRSPLGNYKKNFAVEMVVLLKGKTYKIVRTSNSANLFVKNITTKEFEPLVTGVTAVNEHIKELLGYDLDIYSLTNYCSQKGFVDLTSKTPTGLQKLIEIVSGVDLTDDLDVKLKNRVTSLRAEKRSLNTVLKSTEDNTDEFELNEFFDSLIKESKPSAESRLKFEVLEYRKGLELYKGFLKASGSVFKAFADSEIELEQFRKFESIPIDVLTESLKAVQEAEVKYKTLYKQYNSLPKREDSLPENVLRDQEDKLERYNRYLEYEKLKSKLECHSIECPNCNHEFHVTDMDLAKEFETVPIKPYLTAKDISEYRAWNSVKDSAMEMFRELQDLEKFLEEHPSVSDIDEQIKNYQTFVSVRDKLIKNKNSLNAFLSELRRNTLFTTFFEECPEYDSSFKSRFKKYVEERLRASELGIESTEKLMLDLVKYRADKKAHLRTKKILADIQDKLATNEQRLAELIKIQSVVKRSKTQLRTQSLPVINKWASDLVDLMTNSERSLLTIENDFKINLDLMPVDVAEMSAQVIANIALRFGLLNTFHKDSLAVFIGDEVDSSLHADRFSFLERSLNNLVELGYQIIIVSHKDFSSGNIIEIQKL